MFPKKPKILNIEIRDEEINKEICNLMMQIEKNISGLQQVLRNDMLVHEKEEKSGELEKEFTQLKEEAQKILDDVNRIAGIEMEKKQFIKLNDDNFLNDKKEQLEKITADLRDLLGTLAEKPSIFDLKSGVMQDILDKTSEIIVSISKMRLDDRELEKIYNSLDGL